MGWSQQQEIVPGKECDVGEKDDPQEAAKLKNMSMVDLVPPEGNVVTGEPSDDDDPGDTADRRRDEDD